MNVLLKEKLQAKLDDLAFDPDAIQEKELVTINVMLLSV